MGYKTRQAYKEDQVAIFRELATSIQLVDPACNIQEDPMYGVYFVNTPTKQLVLVGPFELQEMLVTYGMVGEQALINAVLSANQMQKMKQMHMAMQMIASKMAEER